MFQVNAQNPQGSSSCMIETAKWIFKGTEFTGEPKAGGLNPANCLQEAEDILKGTQFSGDDLPPFTGNLADADTSIQGAWRGPGFQNQKVVLTSGLYWILKDAGLVEGQEYVLANVNEARLNVCKTGNVELQENNKPFLCASVTYVCAALQSGWKIGAQQKFMIFRTMGGSTVSWTLGVAVSE